GAFRPLRAGPSCGPPERRRAARGRPRRRRAGAARPCAARRARAGRPGCVPAADRPPRARRVRARSAAGRRGPDPGALRPLRDAAPRGRPRPAGRPAPGAQSTPGAGDRRPRELLAHHLLRGPQAAPRAVPEARLAGGPADGDAAAPLKRLTERHTLALLFDPRRSLGSTQPRLMRKLPYASIVARCPG